MNLWKFLKDKELTVAELMAIDAGCLTRADSTSPLMAKSLTVTTLVFGSGLQRSM